jgi:hypothetical protein
MFQSQDESIVYAYKLKSLVFQVQKHEISACDLQKLFHCLDGMEYFCYLVWKWICVLVPFVFQET